MAEPDGLLRMVIPEPLMNSRLAQFGQMREFFIQRWLQNPVLARRGGSKVQSHLSRYTLDYAVVTPYVPSGMVVDVGGDGK